MAQAISKWDIKDMIIAKESILKSLSSLEGMTTEQLRKELDIPEGMKLLEWIYDFDSVTYLFDKIPETGSKPTKQEDIPF